MCTLNKTGKCNNCGSCDNIDKRAEQEGIALRKQGRDREQTQRHIRLQADYNQTHFNQLFQYLCKHRIGGKNEQ